MVTLAEWTGATLWQLFTLVRIQHVPQYKNKKLLNTAMMEWEDMTDLMKI